MGHLSRINRGLACQMLSKMPKENSLFAAVRRSRVLFAGALISVVLAVIVATPRMHWRCHVLLLHAAGQIPDIELRQLLAYVMPGSDQWMAPLIETRNPYAVVRNHRTTTADITAGSRRFRAQCGVCHAPDATGGPGGPRLVNHKFRNGESDWALYKTIRYGIPNTAMTRRSFSDTETWQVVSFLRSLGTGRATEQDSSIIG